MSYAPLTRDEVETLAGLKSSNPREERYINWLVELFSLYETLRARGLRPGQDRPDVAMRAVDRMIQDPCYERGNIIGELRDQLVKAREDTKLLQRLELLWHYEATPDPKQSRFVVVLPNAFIARTSHTYRADLRKVLDDYLKARDV